jgi:hypothetical protein
VNPPFLTSFSNNLSKFWPICEHQAGLGFCVAHPEIPTMEAMNPLLSVQKPSDGIQVILHPLPILEISDHVVRAYKRGHKGAIVGGLLGQQNDLEITIEHSFNSRTILEDGRYTLDPEWFADLLDQRM